jgi:predicted nucleic-acid-binding protein
MTNNKQQTAVEWLFDRIKIKADSISCNTQNNRMVKGAYVDCLMLIMEAKKMGLEQIITKPTEEVSNDKQ